MASGTVKWFNPDKGFGFIAPDDGGKDVFVHITAVREAGLETLNDDQKVEFEMEAGRDGRGAGRHGPRSRRESHDLGPPHHPGSAGRHNGGRRRPAA